VTHRLLSLPFARSRQLEQTVPFELESQIPFALEQMLVDFQTVQRTETGVTVLAVAVTCSLAVVLARGRMPSAAVASGKTSVPDPAFDEPLASSAGTGADAMSRADCRSWSSSTAMPSLSCWVPSELAISSELAFSAAVTCCRRA